MGMNVGEPHKYEDPAAPIDFAADLAGLEAEIFLRLWREGDWSRLDREWPEWRAYTAARKMPPPTQHWGSQFAEVGAGQTAFPAPQVRSTGAGPTAFIGARFE